MSAEIRTYFAISHDGRMNFEEFDKVDLTPTAKRQFGDILRKNYKSKFSYWHYSTDEVENWDYQEVLNGLLDDIIPFQEQLKEITVRNGYDCDLVAVISVDTNLEEPTPAIILDKRTIDFLAYMGAEFEVDLYRHDSSEDD